MVRGKEGKFLAFIFDFIIERLRLVNPCICVRASFLSFFGFFLDLLGVKLWKIHLMNGKKFLVLRVYDENFGLHYSVE